MKYTVFFDQINRTNFQVTAANEDKALEKACRLYKKRIEIPEGDVEEGWVEERDGEDK